MSKHKVAELEGRLLNAAVAKAEGYTFRLTEWDCEVDGLPSHLEDMGQDGCYDGIYAPSGEWRQGGEIIERERMYVAPVFEYGTFYGEWRAIVYGFDGQGKADETGHTPLIAAMRAYVVSELGDEVELP